MTTYLIRRLLLMIPTLLGITVLVFAIMKAAPGDVTQMLVSNQGEMTPGDRQARVEYIRKRYGLDLPVYVQYFRWLHQVSPVGVFTEDETSGVGLAVGQVAEGENAGSTRRFGLKVPDLGHSFVRNRPVLALVGEALPTTIILNLLSLPMVYVLAITSGVYAAKHRGRAFDKITGLGFIMLWSVPGIWAGVMLQGYLANSEYFQIFPASNLHDLRADEMRFLPHWGGEGFQRGWLLDFLWHLCLPVICLSYGSFAFMSKLSRGAVLENLVADYVRTARAKGVGAQSVLWRHAFRNSLLPLITVAALVIPGMLGGSIVVEFIFGLEGMGKLMISSIEFKDQEVVMADTLIIAMIALAAFLLADVCYAIADPRISYE